VQQSLVLLPLLVAYSVREANRRFRRSKPIDFQAEQQQAIQQNLAALQPSADLAKKTTEIEQSQLENQLRRAIPGYDQLVQQASKNIGASLRGELSPETTRNIQRFAAAQALGGGYRGGSGMGVFNAVGQYARASEARQNLGISPGSELHPAAASVWNGSAVLGEQYVHHSCPARERLAAATSCSVRTRSASCSGCCHA